MESRALFTIMLSYFMKKTHCFPNFRVVDRFFFFFLIKRSIEESITTFQIPVVLLLLELMSQAA